MDIQKFKAPSLGALEPSATLGISAKAKAMKAAGEDVISLSAGEPDFDTPEFIKQAAIAALEAGDTKYTPVAGKPELREAIANKLTTENRIICEAGNIVVAPGAKYSLFTAIAALAGPGAEVIVPTPFWLSYASMIKAVGARPIYLNTGPENDFCICPEELEASITDCTRLIILNTPANPTGTVYTRDILEKVADIAIRHDVMVIADEIYEKLIYDDDHKHVSIASLNEEIAKRTITINGFSKAYSMTGWRLGYMAAPDWIVSRVSALQSHTTSNPTAFVQAGALAAITEHKEKVDEMCARFHKRRDRIYDLLTEIPGISVTKPHGAFYIFPSVQEFEIESMAFAERLLTENKLAVIPGAPFGAPYNIRLSYAYSIDVMEKGVARLADFCSKLNK